MKLKEFNILLDIKEKNNIKYIEVVQDDYNSNVLNISLIDELNSYDLTDLNVEIAFKKPDGTTVLQDKDTGVSIIDAKMGKIKCILSTNTIACPGIVNAEVRISESSNVLTSARFNFYVRGSLVTDEAVKSTNEFPILKKLTDDVKEATNEFPAIKELFDRAKIDEPVRVSQENTRVLNENNRIAAENARQTRLELPHYDEAKGEYVNLDKFWDSLRCGKKYTTEFNQYSVSPSPLGTKKDDNVGLVCEPSTNTVKGRNDYENIGLFMSFDVNGYIDENDDYHVTAIKGDGKFKADGTNGDVWVMAMVGYTKYYSTDTVWGLSYADVLFPGYDVIQEAVKPDGTIRPYLLHAKYAAGRNPLDGKLASISGVSPEYNNMSHNGQITEFKAKGAQYSGKTSHDDFYISMMFYIKYATLNQESIMKGCINYYLQYANLVAETGVKRVIVTNSQANNLIVGSCVSIGDYSTGTISDDRGNAQNYNKADRVKITKIEDLGNGNSAVYVDSANTFDTTLTTTITTYPWQTGACDNVLGADGSPYSNSSGKEPCMINGIEFMVGGYEVIQNLIIYNDNTDMNDYNIKVYACYDCKKYATSPTSDYDLISYRIAKTNEVWQYITKIGIDFKHPSVIVPIEVGGSSTTGFADGLYSNKPVTGYRGWLSLGYLYFGSLCGLRCLGAAGGLADAWWVFLGRLSATGRSRRRAGVN